MYLGPLLSLLLKKDMVDDRVVICGCGVSVSGCVVKKMLW